MFTRDGHRSRELERGEVAEEDRHAQVQASLPGQRLRDGGPVREPEQGGSGRHWSDQQESQEHSVHPIQGAAEACGQGVTSSQRGQCGFPQRQSSSKQWEQQIRVPASNRADTPSPFEPPCHNSGAY